MSGMKIEGFLHFISAKSDKIWGIVSYNDSNIFKFWGRRPSDMVESKAIAINKEKVHGSGGYPRALRRAKDEIQKKAARGYRLVPVEDIDRLIPGFTEELENRLLMAQLSDGFRNSEKTSEEE